MSELKSKLKPVLYCLEIYKPHSARDVLVRLAAGDPFMAISVGDVINTWGWKLKDFVSGMITVKKVVHLLKEVDTHVFHKIVVMTTDDD